MESGTVRRGEGGTANEVGGRLLETIHDLTLYAGQPKQAVRRRAPARLFHPLEKGSVAVQLSQRARYQQRLFPDGIPRLWCPTLTYFAAAHQLDAKRIESHLFQLAPFVKGILVPGSTGEGWEMTDGEVQRLLAIVLPIAERLKVRVLVGVLKTEIESMLGALDALSEFIAHSACVGVTVCPPQGAHLSQSQLADGVRRILQRQLPTALYQLPQVTQNELAPETVAELAAEFPNLIMFKDTSGEDRVALSRVDLGGVFLVRGSERGGYATWTRGAGGPYDGFLLSTANCVAPELASILDKLDRGQVAQARQLSAQLERIVTAAFDLVKDFPSGNPFTNANKILDHLRTFGDQATAMPPPLLISGVRLPVEMVIQMREMLAADPIALAQPTSN